MMLIVVTITELLRSPFRITTTNFSLHLHQYHVPSFHSIIFPITNSNKIQNPKNLHQKYHALISFSFFLTSPSRPPYLPHPFPHLYHHSTSTSIFTLNKLRDFQWMQIRKDIRLRITNNVQSRFTRWLWWFRSVALAMRHRHKPRVRPASYWARRDHAGEFISGMVPYQSVFVRGHIP